MAKSIMQTGKYCYLCSLYENTYNPGPLEEHHAVFGPGRRYISERLGLKVYLCPLHHRISKRSAHKSAETALLLKQKAQEAFEKQHTHEEWMEIIGKNYIYDPKEKEDKTKTEGFWFLEEHEQDHFNGQIDQRS